MPKSAQQRMTATQARAACRDRTPVAVAEGFKRGITTEARRAMILRLDAPRLVFRGHDDFTGHEVRDGVVVRYDDQAPDEDGYIVTPSDLLSTWDEFVQLQERVEQSRKAASEQQSRDAAMMEGFVRDHGGEIRSDLRGVFLSPDEIREMLYNLGALHDADAREFLT